MNLHAFEGNYNDAVEQESQLMVMTHNKILSVAP